MRQAIARWDGQRKCWVSDQLNLLSGQPDVWQEIWPESGMTLSGVLYPLPPLGHRTGALDCSLLPTPQANLGSCGGAQTPEKRRSGGHSVSLADVVEHLHES